MVNVGQSVKILLIMDYSGAVLGGALLFHQVKELKRATDGTVWVGPAGGAEAFNLQNVVILL